MVALAVVALAARVALQALPVMPALVRLHIRQVVVLVAEPCAIAAALAKAVDVAVAAGKMLVVP